MNEVKLSSGENANTRSVLAEAGSVAAGTLVSFCQTEVHAVSGLEKKGLVVRLDGEVQITDAGAMWLKTERA